MAQLIPLPKHSDLPSLVVFHREHPADPVFLMQVPTNEDRTEFETYLIKLESPDHVAWFDRLSRARDLRDKLSYEMHVAYCPQTGHLQEMADFDMPSATQMAVATARFFGARGTTMDEAVERRRRIERVAPAPVSRLREILGGPEQRLGRLYGGGR
jgi:hypothetical protein